MKTFRFLDFPVYIEAKDLVHDVLLFANSLPRSQYSLADQIRRCALSVCLNIAEGSAKKSDKDFNRYIEISLGSVNELVAAIDIAFSEKLIRDLDRGNIVNKAEHIAKQLGGFSKTLRCSVKS